MSGEGSGSNSGMHLISVVAEMETARRSPRRFQMKKRQLEFASIDG
jgi:hypothetical protein